MVLFPAGVLVSFPSRIMQNGVGDGVDEAFGTFVGIGVEY